MSALDSIRNRVIGSGVCTDDHPSPACQTIQDRARLLAALDAVLAVANSIHDPSVIQYSFHIGTDFEYDAWKAQVARRIRSAIDDALEAGK